jgi:hypothetical protein
MNVQKNSFDFWYAAANTEVVLPPSRQLQTFGSTLINYHLVSELLDEPGRVRIREGRLEAGRPTLIMPSDYAKIDTSGFGDEAKKYLEFLREHEDSVRILEYGYSLKQEAFSEQVVTDSVPAVVDRVVAEVKSSGNGFDAVLIGVDDPWDVALVKLFWMEVNASAAANVRELEERRVAELAESAPRSVREEVERAFEKAERNPSLVNELGGLLRRKGVFEQYQDRFFKLVRR